LTVVAGKSGPKPRAQLLAPDAPRTTSKRGGLRAASPRSASMPRTTSALRRALFGVVRFL
jgi:hypothetical protein